MLKGKKIAIIGSGTMGRALAGGLLRSGKVVARDLRGTARTKATAERLTADLGVKCSTDNAEACRTAGIVVLCVKPKDIQKVVEGLGAKGALAHAPLLVSIAAGVSTGFIEGLAPKGTPVVRAMPNTPCFIGKGMTVVSKGTNATDEHAALAREIFSTMGRALELEEKHMDTVTGLSASGPAFIYLIIEALADGGVMRGLPRNVANELAAQMTLGAAEMVLTTGRHPAAAVENAEAAQVGAVEVELSRHHLVEPTGEPLAGRLAGEARGKSRLEFGEELCIAIVARGGIEPHHMREHHPHRLAMDDAVRGCERVGQSVGGAEHRIFDRHAGPGGPQLNRLPGRHIGRAYKHLREVVGQQPEGLPGEEPRGGRGGEADMALHGVGEGIDARQGGYPRRLRQREQKVEDRHAKRRAGIAAGHLHVRLCIGNQGKRLHLAAGASGGGHGDRREHWRRRLAAAPVVGHPPAAAEQEVDPLGTVHRAAAADPHDDVGTKGPGAGCARVNMLRGRVFGQAREALHRQPCLL